MGGSWSLDHDPTESGISVEGAKAVSGDEVIVVVALPLESRALEGGSFENPEGELLEDRGLKEELLRDSEGDFLTEFIWFEIWEPVLERLRSKYQISPEFRLEVPLDTDRAYNPPPNRLTLYKEYFPAGLRLQLFSFSIEFFKAIGLTPCVVISNTW